MRRQPEKPAALKLLDALFKDAIASLPECKRDLERDLKTIKHRVAHEGIFFLTTVLPEVGKKYLQGLDSGRQPLLNGGLLGKLFPWAIRPWYGLDGWEIIPPPADVVRTLLQICFLYRKLELNTPDEFHQRAVDEFLARNKACEDRVYPNLNLPRRWIQKVFKNFDLDKLRPRNGSGAINEKDKNKIRHYRLCLQSESVFPAKEWLFGGDGMCYDAKAIRPMHHYTSRLVTVPKDATKPRLIAIENSQAMFLQQGIMHYMYKALKRVGIDLTNQENMRSLCYDTNYVTVDFSAASDSISLDLVRILFGLCPGLLDALEAVRSHEASWNGENHKMQIYATMGNATTFPVLTATLAALGKGYGLRMHVYGDDVIIHKDDFKLYEKITTNCGFNVNKSKTFTGYFRESCGLHVYRGQDVTPVYVRDLSRAGLCDVTLCDTANQFVAIFYHHISGAIFSEIEDVRGRLPHVGNRQVGYLSRRNPRFGSRIPITKKWCSRYHVHLIKAWTTHDRERTIEYGNDHLTYAYRKAAGEAVVPTAVFATSLRKEWVSA